MKIELSPDQNTLTIDCVTYEAKPARGSCTDCYFGPNTKVNCKHPLALCCSASACIGLFRKDRRDIIWVKKVSK